MSEENTKRLTIIASVVTILGAIWYFIRGDKFAAVQTFVTPGGDVQPVGAPAIINSPTGTPISVTVSGNTYNTSPLSVPDVTAKPGDSAGYPGYGTVQNNYPTNEGTYLTPSLNYNLPPSLDMIKFLDQQDSITSVYAGGSGSGGCGCGSGSGENGIGKRGGCSNAASSSLFTDGRGNCFSSTPGNLTKAMESCQPGAFDAMKDNMQSSIPTIYAGIDSAAYSMLAQQAPVSEPNLFTPPFSFVTWVQ